MTILKTKTPAKKSRRVHACYSGARFEFSPLMDDHAKNTLRYGVGVYSSQGCCYVINAMYKTKALAIGNAKRIARSLGSSLFIDMKNNTSTTFARM